MTQAKLELEMGVVRTESGGRAVPRESIPAVGLARSVATLPELVLTHSPGLREVRNFLTPHGPHLYSQERPNVPSFCSRAVSRLDGPRFPCVEVFCQH